MNTDPLRPVLTVRELATRWGVNVKTVYEAIELGQLPVIRVGRRRLLIPRVVVEELEKGRVMPEGAV